MRKGDIMSMKLDCKGLQCPFPVIKTKQELEKIESGTIEVTVDNDTARTNILKFAKSNGFDAKVIRDEEKDIAIEVVKGEGPISVAEDENSETEMPEFNGDEIILFKTDKLGEGADELGKILMKSFIFTLTETPRPPKTLLFVNGGVKLTSINEETVDSLKKLEEKGLEIMSCGMCLDYYEVKDKLAVGEVTNMYVIVEKITQASKVITI